MATEIDTARYNYDNYRFCYENGHEEWLAKAARCFDFWRSKQWSAADLEKLRQAGRPALTFNVIESLVRVMKGTQRALRNDVRFSPVQSATSETAKVQDALWLHAQNRNSLDFLETDMYERALVTGRGYYDIRVEFDEQLQGHATITTPRSQDIVLDPAIDTYEPDKWPQVFQAKWNNLLDIENLYGKDKAEALRHRGMPAWYSYEDTALARHMGAQPYYAEAAWGEVDNNLIRGYRLIDRQFYVLKMKDVFIDTNTGDMSEIPETWDRARISRVLELTPGLSTFRRKIKTVRWTVTCEDVVLHDEDSPYKWFTTVPYFPTFMDGVTFGPVENLLDPQELFNKVTSQELHIINTTANSGYKLKKGSLKNMTVEEVETSGARTGVVFELDDPNDLEKLTPNQVPAGHDRLSFKADQIMRSLSGVPNQARGFAREDVANEAILANQAASDVNFAGPLANLHRSKQILAMRAQDCFRAYYTETRVIMINRGSTYKPEFEGLTINQPTPEGTVVNDVTQGKYTTTLVPAPSRSNMSESELKEMIMLRKDLGIPIPDEVFIELSNASNKMQIIQLLKGDSNEAQQRAQDQAERIQQLEEQLLQAKTEKEMTAAQLNAARANKFQADAGIDPDAAYERVETARIASDARTAREKIASDERKAGMQRRGKDQDTAVKLTQIEAENARHSQKLTAGTAAAKSATKPSTKEGKPK